MVSISVLIDCLQTHKLLVKIKGEIYTKFFLQKSLCTPVYVKQKAKWTKKSNPWIALLLLLFGNHFSKKSSNMELLQAEKVADCDTNNPKL